MTNRKRKDGILELPGGKFQAAVWATDERGRRVKKEKSFPTRSLAKQWRAAQKTDLIRGDAHLSEPRVTIDALRVRWLERRAEWVRAKYPQADEIEFRKRLSRHTLALAGFVRTVNPERRVTRITADDFEAYKRARLADGLHVRTVNRELTAIRQVLSAAVSLFPELRRWQPPRPRMLPESKRGRERVLTEDEESRLLFALEMINRDAADFFILAIDTAMRLNEVLRLKWANIAFDHDRFDGGAIEVVSTKVDRSKLIPMTSRVREVLERRSTEATSGAVFAHRPGMKGPLSPIYQAIKRAAKAAGVSYGRDVAGGWMVHDLRRTAINRMLLRTNFDYVTVQKLAGLSIEILLNSYARTDADRMRAAVG